ncbi:triose-phosphate isomerase [Candidatus Shapirobacteria bacterium]|nr:triose-phosphate isomerase [Candidatus Shapirobacteria bacterium]
MILINFKIYKETFGEGAVKLARICKEVADKTGVKIYPIVSALDVYRITKEVGIEVFVQAVDTNEDGAKTGAISAEQAKQLGAIGALINHSERKLPPGKIKELLASWPKGFLSVMCVHSAGQVERWGKNIKCDMVAYEPSYLISSKDKSVATEKPEVIKKIADFYQPRNIAVLAGAGVHSENDVKISLKMGAKGVLLASDVVKSEDPKKELTELAEAF